LNSLVDIVLYGLAGWRIAQLSADVVFEKFMIGLLNIISKPDLRFRFLKFVQAKILYLLDCVYCLTFWTTLILYLFIPYRIIMFLAVWAVASIIANILPNEDSKE
jgi:hypothetical protein